LLVSVVWCESEEVKQEGDRIKRFESRSRFLIFRMEGVGGYDAGYHEGSVWRRSCLVAAIECATMPQLRPELIVRGGLEVERTGNAK
jgi:hypothetical protein